MDKNRKYEYEKLSRNKHGRSNPNSGRERNNENKKHIVNRSFNYELKEIILDIFYNSKLTREFEISRSQVIELLEFKPSYHFNSYLNCCICYENTLLCSIGKCDHMTCLLCSLKLTYFYKNDCNKGIYECPYCKQPNDYIYFCVNPFYVHLSLNKKFYSSKDSPVMTKNELDEFMRILTYTSEFCDKDSAEINSSATINIMQLYKIFLKNSSKVANLFNINGLLKSVSSLYVSGEKIGNSDINDREGECISFSDQFLIVNNENLIFESAGIYYLYKLITSPLCWFSECRSRWYFNIINKENIGEALKKVSKFKFSSYKFLNRHMKGSHSVVFCDICMNYFTNKKFLCECLLYDISRIGDHVKNGDTNSYPPISPHVFCTACKTYHWDMASFKQHGKDQHFICELCDISEDLHSVFSDYTSLFNHFKTYHYPCEEEECMFIVFSDDLQLQLHYLYKHPGVTRAKCTKKPIQVNTKLSRDPKSTRTSSVFSTYEDQSAYDFFWDGSINIVKPSLESNQNEGIIETKVIPDPLESLKDSSLGYYFLPLETSITSCEDDRNKLEKFLNGLKGNKDLPVASDYINNFDVTRSSHVFADLESMMGYFKKIDVNLFDVTSYLTEVLSKLYICLVSSFTNHYNEIVANCTTDSSDGSSLFNTVKSYITKFLFLFYNIHINKPRQDPKKMCINLDLLKLREHNSDIKLGPNSILFFIAILNFSNISNRLIVKAALNSLITDMRSMYKDVQEPISLSEAFNLQTKNISSSAMNPDANIDEFISKKHRNQNIVKIPRKGYIVSLKGKKIPNEKEQQKQDGSGVGRKVIVKHTGTNNVDGLNTQSKLQSQSPSSAQDKHRQEKHSQLQGQVNNENDQDYQNNEYDNENYEENNQSKININDGPVYLEAVEVDTETLFMNHVNNGSFYGLMYDMIGSLLIANMKRFKAKTFEYSLRETTKLKILNIALSQKRSFTNLGEFISMKKLESLQSLEPEFHRLIKECQKSDLPTIAKVWNRKCTNILRNTQVEHLEILHFYLKGNSDASMPLCNDTEFPCLTKIDNSMDYNTPRNYASAVGLQSKPKFLSEHEFPTLGQTVNFNKKHKTSRKQFIHK